MMPHLRTLGAVALVFAMSCGTPTARLSELASDEASAGANPEASAGIVEGDSSSPSTSASSSGKTAGMPRVVRDAHGGAIFEEAIGVGPFTDAGTKADESDATSGREHPSSGGSATSAPVQPPPGASTDHPDPTPPPSSGGSATPSPEQPPPPPGGTATPTPQQPTAAPTTPAPASGPKCPNPKTCDIYQFIEGPGEKGWRPNTHGCSGGMICIRYSINSTRPQGGSISADQIKDAIQAALKIWSSASPKLQFIYLGTTTREPKQGDGFTDFALGNNVMYVSDADGYVQEADILRAPTDFGNAWSWDPCAQRDESCTPTGKGTTDIQDRVTHELGHTLGLADLSQNDARELTMYPAGPADRHRNTLGLGDVLGIRKLYPCNCPLPPIYDP